MQQEQQTGPSFGEYAIAVVVWLVRHWVLVLLAIGLIYGLVHVSESEHPRSGYIDTGTTVTEQECSDRGGTVVDDVCYRP